MALCRAVCSPVSDPRWEEFEVNELAPLNVHLTVPLSQIGSLTLSFPVLSPFSLMASLSQSVGTPSLGLPSFLSHCYPLPMPPHAPCSAVISCCGQSGSFQRQELELDVHWKPCGIPTIMVTHEGPRDPAL